MHRMLASSDAWNARDASATKSVHMEGDLREMIHEWESELKSIGLTVKCDSAVCLCFVLVSFDIQVHFSLWVVNEHSV